MHRRVRHLRLTCAREDHARHGRVLLEDAMRTATFGDETRLVIVRRMNLGRIPLRASATAWSRRLEQSYGEARPIPVRHDHAAAGRADAVYFANAHEPWLIAAERTIAHESCADWYWAAALRGWKETLPAEQTLRLCFRSLATLGGLRLTLLLAQRLQAVRGLAPLLRALRPEDLAVLEAELGWTSVSASPHEAAASRGCNGPDVSADEATFIGYWGARDPRTHWLAAVHVVRASGSNGSVACTAVAPDRIRGLVQRWSERPAQAGAVKLSPDPVLPRRPRSPAEHPAKADTPETAPPKPARVDAEPPDVSERVATRAGGVFFAVPLLVRAGLPGFLAPLPANEAAALPWHILKLLLEHSRIPDDDPLMVAMQSLPPIPQKCGRWLIAANRHALRLTRLNVRQLTARPALITLSATHIDVFFRPGDADIRIRRAGLDVDPGWVPWLARAVAYHFNRDD